MAVFLFFFIPILMISLENWLLLVNCGDLKWKKISTLSCNKVFGWRWWIRPSQWLAELPHVGEWVLGKEVYDNREGPEKPIGYWWQICGTRAKSGMGGRLALACSPCLSLLRQQSKPQQRLWRHFDSQLIRPFPGLPCVFESSLEENRHKAGKPSATPPLCLIWFLPPLAAGPSLPLPHLGSLRCCWVGTRIASAKNEQGTEAASFVAWRDGAPQRKRLKERMREWESCGEWWPG